MDYWGSYSLPEYGRIKTKCYYLGAKIISIALMLDISLENKSIKLR